MALRLRSGVKYAKIICINCRAHATKDKSGRCNSCGKYDTIYRASTTLRIPSKNKVNQWKHIAKLALASKRVFIDNVILRINGVRHSGITFPKSQRETASIKSSIEWLEKETPRDPEIYG